MNIKKSLRYVGVSMIALSSLAVVPSVFALSTTGNVSVNADVKVSVDAKLTQRIDTGKNRAAQEIDRRITSLNSLSAKINSLTRISTEQKASLSGSIQSQITVLTNLKTKIANDNDLVSLKADIKSITESYRIYLLVLPQGRIATAASVIDFTADKIIAIGVKFQSRITMAQGAGKDMSATVTLLNDMNAKLADAKVQTSASIAHTATLKPDNGDATIKKANSDALLLAKTDLKIARTDLQAARADAVKISQALKAVNASVKATSTTTVQ